MNKTAITVSWVNSEGDAALVPVWADGLGHLWPAGVTDVARCPHRGNSTGMDCGLAFLCTSVYTLKTCSLDPVTLKVWPPAGRLLLFLCCQVTGQRLLSKLPCWCSFHESPEVWIVELRGLETRSGKGADRGGVVLIIFTSAGKKQKKWTPPHMPQIMSKSLWEESSFARVLFR